MTGIIIDSYDAFARALFSFLCYCQRNKSFIHAIKYDFIRVNFINNYLSAINDVLAQKGTYKYSESKSERYIQSVNRLRKHDIWNFNFGGNRIFRKGLNKGNVIFRH